MLKAGGTHRYHCFKTLNSAAHVPLTYGYFHILNGGSGLTIHVSQFCVSIWTQNMDKRGAPVNNVMNFRVPQNAGKFLEELRNH